MVEIGNVVEEYKIGNTKVLICDDYCRDKTPEEVQEIIDRVSERALRHFRAVATREKLESQKDNENKG